MTAYSATTDLLTGNVPLPATLNAQKFVDDATDEIDSKIGFVYQTPIDISNGGPVVRPARLLLKRINNFLASGRLLLAADAGGETDTVHAYGWSLIKEATAALDQIASGQIPIEGATKLEANGVIVTAMIVDNLDSESSVEAFYDRIANPNYTFGYTWGEAEAYPSGTSASGLVR